MNLSQTGTREKILAAAYRLFYREGFSRVSVDAIAEATGVTKRTIYYHFKSKDDIVADVLDAQHDYVLGRFKAWAGPRETPLNQVIANLFSQLTDWADGENYMGSGFTRISTELADRPGHPARLAASAHKTMTEKWLSELLQENGLERNDEIARQVMVLIEGSMSLALIHGDTSYFHAAGSAAGELVSLPEKT